MHNNATYRQKPYDYGHRVNEPLCILPHRTVGYGNGLYELDADVKVEYCADANWSKEADEDGLSFLFNLFNEFVQGKHNRQTAEY